MRNSKPRYGGRDNGRPQLTAPARDKGSFAYLRGQQWGPNWTPEDKRELDKKWRKKKKRGEVRRHEWGGGDPYLS